MMCTPPLVPAQSRDMASLRPNTVRVQGTAGAGFGFIVGLEHRALLIATAWHTVNAEADSTPMVCFVPEAGRCRRGEVVYVDDPVDALDKGLDLAVIRVAYPEGLHWRPDAEGPAPATDQPVWFIGRGGDWYIPPRPGRIAPPDPGSGLMRYRDLPVAQGVSGAPVVVDGAIVAMHVSSVAEFGQGVPIGEIARRVRERMRAPWALVPPDPCDEPGRATSDFQGTVVRLYFPWNRIQRALPAIARLHCLGATPVVSPVWEDGALQAEGVVYPRGGLRMARIVQGALADIAPLDARLGPTSEVHVWVR